MNNVDRIFNEKLGGYASAPPASAWEKVESNLPVMAAANPWRWAAILLPIVVAAGWLLTRTEAAQPQVASKTIEAPALAPVTVAPIEKSNTQRLATRKKSVTKSVAIAPIVEPEPETIAIAPETVAVQEITIEPVQLIAEVAEPAPPVSKPMVIEITLDPIVETPEAEKKPLERVAEFALTVKHSDPLGSLRGAKDELFAFDLHKKSTKKN